MFYVDSNGIYKYKLLLKRDYVDLKYYFYKFRYFIHYHLFIQNYIF